MSEGLVQPPSLSTYDDIFETRINKRSSQVSVIPTIVVRWCQGLSAKSGGTRCNSITYNKSLWREVFKD